MQEHKKPDNVVFNAENNTYDAALKPYGTNVGAPAITTTDTLAWKNRSIHRVNQKVQARFAELKFAYETIMEEFEYNKLIFGAKFSFEPIIGEIYHLYKRPNGESFLSIIAPDECDFHALGSFYLNADQIWQKINDGDSL